MQGFVKWFCANKGYGFITGQDGHDYFVHHTGISGEGWKSLANESEVEFEISDDDRPKAINVKETTI